MAQKTVKKAAAKPAAKKAPVKKVATKPAVKKTVAKKTAVKPAPVKQAKMAAPVVDMHECGCGADCHCCGGCKCGASKFGRFVRKLIFVVIVFALGWFAAGLNCGRPHHPRMHFVNGCLDTESVKCPKLQDALPAMDINGDGCITRDEFRAVKRQMRAEVRDIQVQEVESVDEMDGDLEPVEE